MADTKPKSGVGGIAAVADLLNKMERVDRERLLSELAKRDGELTAKIQAQMFVFANLAELGDQAMQTLLREIPPNLLPLALRAAPPEVTAVVYRNLSARAGEALREEIAGSPPRKTSDVEAAQAAILQVAKKLRDGGKLD